MGWKPEHAEARKNRRHNDAEYRDRLNERQRQVNADEQRREYMRAYNIANRERIAEQRKARAAERNRRRREQYANDPEMRERYRAYARGRDKHARFDTRLRSTFGISAADYNTMLERQGGVCAVCGSPSGDERGNRLYVDHCHTTGAVRGLLCSSCNFGIGSFRDNPDFLRNAANYLERERGS